jgi:hypothetical protein
MEDRFTADPEERSSNKRPFSEKPEEWPRSKAPSPKTWRRG